MEPAADTTPGSRTPPPGGIGVHLERSADQREAVDRLVVAAGGRVGVRALLDDLKFRARPTLLPRVLGRAVEEAYAWDSYDQRDPVWWPQGITSSADADVSGRVHGRRTIVITSYAKPVDGVHRGARLTFLDLDTLRYRHALLVVPQVDGDRVTLGALRVHAGGLVWAGDWLHVAATARGFVTCHVDDVVRIPGDDGHHDEIGVAPGEGARAVAALGHRYVLPVRFTHRAVTHAGHDPLRHSFLSLDRDSEPPRLVTGEYGRGKQTTRLAGYALDPATWLPTLDAAGQAHPVRLGEGVVRMQGDAVAGGRHHVTVSRGPWLPGSVLTGQPGGLRRHRWAVPMGPEDITHWPRTDRLWSHSEHPHRRWVWSMRRSWFD